MTTPAPHRIVIVGGGAGGLPLATRLGAAARRGGALEVTLIDRHATHLWKPLLHEVAAGRLDADLHDAAYAAIAHWHGFRFAQGALAGLDRAARRVALAPVVVDGEEMLPARNLPYDTLVVCIGSVGNDFGVPGVQQHAVALDEADDAERFHRRLLAACVRADDRAARGEPAEVHIVIVGGGATGVELAAELRQTTRVHAGYALEHLRPGRDIRITLLEAGARILAPLRENVATAAADLLRRLAIEVRTGERVLAMDASGVTTAQGRHRADLVVWAAGIRAPAVLAGLGGLETNRSHQLLVGPTLQATRDPAVFALGDCAAAPWVGVPGAMLPPRAQVARQQAVFLARALPGFIAGRPLPEFRFHDFGSLVSLGQISAVGTLMGRVIGGSLLVRGLVARALYASLYKLHQVSIYGPLRVVFATLGRALRGRVEPRVKLH